MGVEGFEEVKLGTSERDIAEFRVVSFRNERGKTVRQLARITPNKKDSQFMPITQDQAEKLTSADEAAHYWHGRQEASFHRGLETRDQLIKEGLGDKVA